MNNHSNYREGLKAWLSIVESSTWKKPQDIVNTFGFKAVDLLGKKDTKPSTKSSERVVIDIKGNHIRVIAKYQFHPTIKKSKLYLKWIGTHAEYDKLKKTKSQYDIDMFN
ncbi:type II toxin-antitoxin system HigB family toxin [Aquimarina sp. AU119]|nr:type II toxin-antitoxin system HigB family toxin [Aquimarina sp. AU119]